LDLNLLPVLRALVSHRGVTRAAAQLGVSQPQLSRSLAKLRAQCGDPLLVRSGGGMEPTELALRLVDAVEPALVATATLLAESRRFDPTTMQRTFRLSMNDYEAAVLMPRLLTRVLAEAPGVRLAVISHRPSEVADALRHERVELSVGRFTRPAETLRMKPLYDETLAAVVAAGHPLAVRRVTAARLSAHPHILVSPGGDGDFHGLLDETLAARGLARRVVLSTSHFLAAPWIAAHTGAVLLVPRRLLPMIAAWGLRPLDVALPLPAFRVCMLWRERSQREPAHRWLRQAVEEALRADAPCIAR
jgi:DNA-binding transcriptional LysR family regulator